MNGSILGNNVKRVEDPRFITGAGRYVDDIDAHFARAQAAGTKIISPPADQFWGDRRYEAEDPEGHLWSFHEHLRDVSKEKKVEIEFREAHERLITILNSIDAGI